ncbi:hypothetical protein H5410_021552 [Solanum commersonii]|uniref:Uncharacterized protein n=1 Tax=Solanum commersonii TaxID=4109 RepID=A0A9J5ZEA6_SOLCO|nr:hypothetical protein H5410_021552 [Solanum commersonii]
MKKIERIPLSSLSVKDEDKVFFSIKNKVIEKGTREKSHLQGKNKRINIKEIQQKTNTKVLELWTEGHYARDCWYKKAESNITISSKN